MLHGSCRCTSEHGTWCSALLGGVRMTVSRGHRTYVVVLYYENAVYVRSAYGAVDLAANYLQAIRFFLYSVSFLTKRRRYSAPSRGPAGGTPRLPFSDFGSVPFARSAPSSRSSARVLGRSQSSASRTLASTWRSASRMFSSVTRKTARVGRGCGAGSASASALVTVSFSSRRWR